MARLLEFKPGEGALLEALSVIFFGADAPAPKEIKFSIKAEDEFGKYPETQDSAFKLIGCPFCRQRIMASPRIHTLPEGIGADFILDDKVFDYVASRFDKWDTIPSVLKRPFIELQERIQTAQMNKDLDDFSKIQKYIEDRRNPAIL